MRVNLDIIPAVYNQRVRSSNIFFIAHKNQPNIYEVSTFTLNLTKKISILGFLIYKYLYDIHASFVVKIYISTF